MSESPSSLVYLLYGEDPEYHLELTYSVLSAFYYASRDLRVVLISDRQPHRDDLPIEHLIISESEFSRWTMGGRYRHAAKVNALAMALDHFGGKVAMIDTDTYFTSDPHTIFERIAPSAAVMHEYEGTLADQEGYWDELIGSQKFDINLCSAMYNSGVIGLEASSRHLLNRVLSFMIELHSVSPEVHNIEQFALGHVLGVSNTIYGCEDVVRHYWGFERPFIHARLRSLFPAFTRGVFEERLDQFVEVSGFPAKRKADVLLSKVAGMRNRALKNYSFAILAYRCALNAGEFKNAWARVLADLVNWNKYPHSLVRSRFKQFSPDSLHKVSWLDESTRNAWSIYWAKETRGISES